MISTILSANITNITELKKNPVELSKHKETCVLSNGKPCFYSVSPERMDELLKKERELNSKEKINSDLFNSIQSMQNNGLINWAVMDTLLSKFDIEEA